ncbi:hypothetical protein BT69DRAFT_1280582 [Atractiella rhizophila]|nr:hypothetical protein BT69DRAFT_1280582 [Atractiella rhizophila]
MKERTLISQEDDHGTQSIARVPRVHLITAVTLRHGSLLHLSILPSFLSRLPASTHMLRITFVLPLEFWSEDYGPSKSSYFSWQVSEMKSNPTVQRFFASRWRRKVLR